MRLFEKVISLENFKYKCGVKKNVKDHPFKNDLKKRFSTNGRILWQNLNPLSTNTTKWPNTLKKFISNA